MVRALYGIRHDTGHGLRHGRISPIYNIKPLKRFTTETPEKPQKIAFCNSLSINKIKYFLKISLNFFCVFKKYDIPGHQSKGQKGGPGATGPAAGRAGVLTYRRRSPYGRGLKSDNI